jgi:hypothetical protein
MQKVDTVYKREAIAFTKDNVHSIHHLTIIQRLRPSYMTLEQVAEMKPTYQEQKGHKSLVLTPRVTFQVRNYQATC